MKRLTLHWSIGASAVLILTAGAAVGVVVAASSPGTPSSANQILAQKQQQLAQEQETMAAAPRATKPPAGYVPSFAPCSPVPLPTAGIDDSAVQVGPSSWDVFQTSNQWTGPVTGASGSIETVWAGMTGDQASPPNVPAVEIRVSTWSSDGCTVISGAPELYTYPAATGPLTIEAVQDGALTLHTAAGLAIDFSAADGSFSIVAQPSA
jgi:hypothetical protein